jgi:hypothetical protein
MVAVAAGALGAFGPAVIAFGPVALGLGLTVWALARRDLGRMRRGLTDPKGAALTEEARGLGVVATLMPVFLTAAWAVALAASALLGEATPSEEYVEVKGRVTYNGNPVTGGVIDFVSADEGAFIFQGRIEEYGNYTVRCPVEPVKITIENRMLRPGAREQVIRVASPRPGQRPPDPFKGVYVEIPHKYYESDTTDLTYMVKKGPQTHDIELRD